MTAIALAYSGPTETLFWTFSSGPCCSSPVSRAQSRRFSCNRPASSARVNHVSTEARAAYIAGAGATKDQLEAIVADESLALVDHYRIVRGGLYKGFGAASEIGDGNALAGAMRDSRSRIFAPSL
jgi:hypothetical protein